MRSLIVLSVLFFTQAVAIAGDVRVRGYTRQDGTYVAPHTRSAPNAYGWDNKSYTPSQPAYNESYYQPTRNYSPTYYQPSPTRYNDNNPYNDAPPSGLQPMQGLQPMRGLGGGD